MADLSDVSNALVALASQALYPSGTGQPSVAGVGVKVYGGWPLPEQLDADLRAVPTVGHVSVWPRDGDRNTTRFNADWQQPTAPATTVTATVSGQQVTIGGAAAVGQNVAVVANGQAFIYAVQANDTPASIATALAALIVAAIAGTTSAGPVLTLPNTARIGAARVGGTGSVIRELRRQERQFQLSIWTNTPASRDAIAQPVDVALAAVTFLTLPDGSAARLRYHGACVIDTLQKQGVYRRDLIYTVEYATTQTAAATQVVTEQANFTTQNSNQAQIGAVTVNL